MATYKPLQSIVLTDVAANVTFSGIDQSYSDLVLVTKAKTASNTSMCVRVGNNSLDTGTNYSTTVMEGNGSLARSGRDGNYNFGFITGLYATVTAGNDITTITHFQNYSNTTTYKTWINRGAVPAQWTDASVSLWRSTSAINVIQVINNNGANLSAGSTFELYGIKAGTPKAVGGDVVTTDGTYWYHAFKNSGTFAVQQGSALTADYLLVAGGGGGGGAIAQNYSGSGGGAGGLRLLASQTLVAGTEYTVLVGAGGLGVLSDGTAATQGGNSSFGTASVTGGGKGANGGVGSWGNGGSGGGATADGGSGSAPGAAGGLGNAGNYSPVEGYNGGTGWYGGANKVPGGGGGGAGGVGGNASDGVGGNGGAGTNAYNSVTFTTWLTQTGTGASGYLAGGGGGGSRNGGTAGSGGSGGGGAGAVAAAASNGPTAGNNATANTGSGGGGGGPATSGSVSYKGGNGGSGLVIVRYAV